MAHKITQIVIGLIVLSVIAQIKVRTYENLSPYLYITCMILLISVDVLVHISKGVQRWLDRGVMRFQPYEIAIPLMVARFINLDTFQPSLKSTSIVLILIFLPAMLVATPLDLGTSILITASGLFVLFLSGMSWKLIALSILLLAAFFPVLWLYLMHGY